MIRIYVIKLCNIPDLLLKHRDYFLSEFKPEAILISSVCNYLRDALQEIEVEETTSTSSNTTVLKLHSSLDSNRQLAVSTAGYKGRDHATKTLSESTVRDLQRLGHLDLGKKAYWELARILRRDGVIFPAGGVKAAWDEKWVIFGEIFAPVILNIEQSAGKSAKPVQTPFGFCIDIHRLLNIVTNNKAESITRLKFQLDGGQQFLKMSVNIVSVNEESRYVPNPNSVLTNFVIAIGQGPETNNNLREMFNYPSIRALFDLGIPKQIACDFKVAALLVGIQQAQSSHPCPYCLWKKGVPCTGKPAEARTYDGVLSDLATKSNNVVNHPIIWWKESPMEILALAPLHILIGLTNRLYFAARPSETDHTKQGHQLYKRHCNALLKAKVYRSDYWTGALEGNSCSRLLDAVAIEDIPFGADANPFVQALRALKTVKDKCLGKTRELGWIDSIREFSYPDAWVVTSLPWSLKSHVLSDHYQEYFLNYESISDAGASAISSEQSGEW